MFAQALRLAAENARLRVVVARQRRRLLAAASREADLLRLLDEAGVVIERGTDVVRVATKQLEER